MTSLALHRVHSVCVHALQASRYWSSGDSTRYLEPRSSRLSFDARRLPVTGHASRPCTSVFPGRRFRMPATRCLTLLHTTFCPPPPPSLAEPCFLHAADVQTTRSMYSRRSRPHEHEPLGWRSSISAPSGEVGLVAALDILDRERLIGCLPLAFRRLHAHQRGEGALPGVPRPLHSINMGGRQ